MPHPEGGGGGVGDVNNYDYSRIVRWRNAEVYGYYPSEAYNYSVLLEVNSHTSWYITCHAISCYLYAFCL